MNKEYTIDTKLLDNRVIILSEEINPFSAMKVIKEMLYLDSLNSDDITLYINSPGGIVNDGLAIIDTMNFLESKVITIGMGLCASMAAVILSNGAKGKRYILKNTTVMIHQPLSGTSGQISEMEIEIEKSKKVKKKLNEILAKNTNKTLRIIEKDTDRNYYLSGNDVVNYGIVDNVIM